MIKGINALLISTQNFDRLVSFYQDTIGLELSVNDHGGGKHAEMDFHHIHFAIFPGDSPLQKKGAIAFSLQVDNVWEEHERLVKKGVIFDMPPTKMSFGGILARFRDPDGNGVAPMMWESDLKHE